MIIQFERRVVVTDEVVEICEIVCNENLEDEAEISAWLEEHHWEANVDIEEHVNRQDVYLLELENIEVGA
jgi:hypothetical protein